MFTRIKMNIAKKILFWKSRKDIYKFDSKNVPRIFLIDTPNHGNLGDHLIAFAQIKFIQDFFPTYKLFEVSEDDFNESILPIKKTIRYNDLIFLSGGGNLGDKYILDEKIRRKTISLCKKNTIFIFPQTICFSHNVTGFIEKIKTGRIYKKNSKLFILTREKPSYNLAVRLFPKNKCYLFPDIALYLSQNLFRIDKIKNEILLLLRNDLEKKISIDFEEQMLSALYDRTGGFFNIIKADTVVPYQVSSEKRNVELDLLFNKINSASLIITDRLHGVILAAISGTRCIALPNIDNKIQGVYESWLKDYEYITYCSSLQEVISAIQVIDFGKLKKYFYYRKNCEFENIYSLIDNSIKQTQI